MAEDRTRRIFVISVFLETFELEVQREQCYTTADEGVAAHEPKVWQNFQGK